MSFEKSINGTIALANDDAFAIDLPHGIIVTDPPFNVGYKYRTYKDTKSEEEYYGDLRTLLVGKSAVVIHYPEQLHRLSIELGYPPQKVVSWTYNSNTTKQHRDIAFYNVNPNMSQVLQPYKNLNDKRIQARIEAGKLGAKLYDWWNINQVKNVSKEKLDHPCQMPLEVMRNIIGILPKDVTIIDPFMGTGTTGAAVIAMNNEQSASRKFAGVELDEEYFEIARERLLGWRN